jgi:RHS repeat-associated protein
MGKFRPLRAWAEPRAEDSEAQSKLVEGAEQNTAWGSFQSSYQFNSKEFDSETGYGYYGARYYTPEWSARPEPAEGWLSVDPLARRYPSVTPYNFVEGNPMRLIDPTGLGPILPFVGIKNFFQRVDSWMGGAGWKTYRELEDAKWMKEQEKLGVFFLNDVYVLRHSPESMQENGSPIYSEGEGGLDAPRGKNGEEGIETFPMGGAPSTVQWGKWGTNASHALSIVGNWFTSMFGGSPSSDQKKGKNSEPSSHESQHIFDPYVRPLDTITDQDWIKKPVDTVFYHGDHLHWRGKALDECIEEL